MGSPGGVFGVDFCALLQQHVDQLSVALARLWEYEGGWFEGGLRAGALPPCEPTLSIRRPYRVVQGRATALVRLGHICATTQQRLHTPADRRRVASGPTHHEVS
jgi:hypothetical protein